MINLLFNKRLEITSNRAERVVKPFVIVREYRLFSDTDKSADASVRCYSIIGSASLIGMNVFGYLPNILIELPKIVNEMTDEQLDSLLLWFDILQDFCK